MYGPKHIQDAVSYVTLWDLTWSFNQRSKQCWICQWYKWILSELFYLCILFAAVVYNNLDANRLLPVNRSPKINIMALL